MAAMEKFGAGQAEVLLRHNAREIANNSNPDIDPDRRELNREYITRDGGPIKYLHRRLKELHKMDRKDIITMVEWIVTLPQDVAAGMEQRFMDETYLFLRDRYGGMAGENIVSAQVHADEAGQPHMHFDFVPVAKRLTADGLERLCAKEVCTRADLRSFHSDLQRHLDAAGIHCTVVDRSVITTGKTLREQYRERGEERPRSWRPQEKKLERVRDRSRERQKERGRGMFDHSRPGAGADRRDSVIERGGYGR